MDIGEKLRSLRQLRSLTQEELADRCELSKGFISQVERNREFDSKEKTEGLKGAK